MGFVINPYDRCIANKMIDGKQFTIAWHINYNKVSHVSKEVFHEIMEVLEGNFGKFTKTEGNKHEYLGMNIELRNDGKVEIDMIKHIEKIISEFSEEIQGRVSSPATKDLYNTSKFKKLLTGMKRMNSIQ